MPKKVLPTAIVASVCILITGIAVLIAGIASIHLDTEYSNVLSLLEEDPPGEFYIYPRDINYSGEIIFPDSGITREFHDIVKNKAAKRLYNEKPASEKIILTMDYGYKNNTVKIDTEGRISIFEDTASIRNKSRLHWLWWKLDGILLSKGNAHLIYVTEPDAKVLELANTIANNPALSP